MKIKKLTEAMKLVEEDNLNPIEDSPKEAAQEVIDGAAEGGVEVSPEEAKQEVVNAIKEANAFQLNPYASTAKLSEVEKKLQACLEATMFDKENGFSGDYPDLLIYGLAGFGKTAGVKKFCKDHNIIPLELDAKTLRPENLAGIPKVVTDEEGNEFQAAVPEARWIELKKSNKPTILIVDEVNRAKPNITGTLLGLICDHDLPIPYKDNNGNWHSMTHYGNILFTVAMINPASRDLFQDVNELDPAFMGRMAKEHEAKPDKREFLNVVRNLYNTILKNPLLSQEALNKYQGQLDLAEALLFNSAFKFDDRDKAVQAHKAQRTEFRPRVSLSYRTLMKCLRLCDGTRTNFLKQVKEIGFLPETALLIENCLAQYQDKVSKGNSVFQKSTSPAAAQRSVKADVEVDKILSDFADSLI